MEVITCPQHMLNYAIDAETPTIFLGGGISGCVDWQKEMIARFTKVSDLVLVNPRREDFDITDPTASVFQIKWEYEHLNLCDAILFWFPHETLCPITLFELGKYATMGKLIFVGYHPGYARAIDVREQLSHFRPDVVVHDNFTDMIEEIDGWLETRQSR